MDEKNNDLDARIDAQIEKWGNQPLEEFRRDFGLDYAHEKRRVWLKVFGRLPRADE